MTLMDNAIANREEAVELARIAKIYIGVSGIGAKLMGIIWKIFNLSKKILNIVIILSPKIY
jgi:hypothetical protein